MPVLQLFFGTDPGLKHKALPVENVNDEILETIKNMYETLYEFKGIGMAANMVGIFKKIIIIDLQEDGKKTPITLINPELTWASDTKETKEEASLCFPGISAKIERSNAIKVSFRDTEGNTQELAAEGWLATVIQHEMDYLEGKSYLDHLSKMKKDRLIKKMIKMHKRPHTHSCGDPSCTEEH